MQHAGRCLGPCWVSAFFGGYRNGQFGLHVGVQNQSYGVLAGLANRPFGHVDFRPFQHIAHSGQLFGNFVRVDRTVETAFGADGNLEHHFAQLGQRLLACLCGRQALVGLALQLFALSLKLFDVGLGGRHSLAARQQIVSAVAAAHRYGVAQLAKVVNVFKQNKLHCSPRQSVVVRIRQQSQVACPLDCRAQLALVACLGAGYAAGNDFSRFADKIPEQLDILVVDLLNAFYRKPAKLASSGESCHYSSSALAGSVSVSDSADDLASSAASTGSCASSGRVSSEACSSAAASASALSSEDCVSFASSVVSASRCCEPRCLSRLALSRSSLLSLRLSITEGSVSALSLRTTRWRKMASLKRKTPSSSSRVAPSHSMLISR